MAQKQAGKHVRSRPKDGPDPDSKKTLITAAKRLFARRGLNGTSIRDIAREAKMNSSMISYYFKGKNGLYRACLQEIGSTRLQFTRDLLASPANFQDYRLRLELFAESLFKLFLEDRDIGLIIIREYDRLHSPAEKVFKENFLNLIETIVHYFKDSQSKGFVSSSFDPYILASLFFGCLSSQLRLDHINEKSFGRSLKDPSERNRISSQLVEIFSRLKPSMIEVK
ncbi:MAG: TetR family transcriptional regulator [Bdellovibrionales bacterium]|nr:TetR family transcriptional regulator [Bdellovibrionales bacterium]